VKNLCKNEHEMTMITKKVKTHVSYVSPRNMGLSLGKVHCSLRKLPFHPGEESCPWGEGV
jgi:hypothetical protein